MALLDLSKFALLALLISAMVSTLGGAEMVIREVVRKGSDDETCKANGEVCGPTFGKCCEGYICIGGHWPPSPWSGSCIPEGDLPDTFKTNRAEAGDEAQMVIKEEVMMVEKIKFCLPRGAHCHMAAGPRCCGRFECLPRIPGTKPLSGKIEDKDWKKSPRRSRRKREENLVYAMKRKWSKEQNPLQRIQSAA